MIDGEAIIQRLLNSRKWTSEQIEAIKSIRVAPGVVALISGPPGTGKTEVAHAISDMLIRQCGYHVIFLGEYIPNERVCLRPVSKAPLWCLVMQHS